ncbi:MAG: diacylglycerol kinase family protein [Eubacteriales bacterium]|nr:diacylglycerol kinase family protein [Eubacteriales bacterium]
MKYYFIVNPNANGGRGLKLWNRMRSYLSKRNAEYEIYFTASSGEGADIARFLTEGLSDGSLNIFVIGGDGTLNEVLNGLHHVHKVNLCYIPTVPGEGLAKSLKLIDNPKTVIGRMNANDESARIEAMDYGVLTCENGEMIRRFVNSSGIGFDAALAQRLKNKRSSNDGPAKKIGRITLLKECVKELIFSRPVSGYIILDGTKRVEFNNLIFVSAHIHPYEWKFKFGSYADPKDGILEICAVNCKNRVKFVPMLLASRFKGRAGSPRMKMYQCSEAHIHFDRPAVVHTDGECIRSQTDIDIRCIRQQLNIFR